MSPVDRSRSIGRLLDKRLTLLRELTGLPMVFGGATTPDVPGGRLVISQLHGAMTDSLAGLSVPSGLGLGGRAIARGRPCVVNDYKASRRITHHFDSQVVEAEKLVSIFAIPVRAAGRVVAVFYGASRDGASIGDVALRRASGVAVKLERDITALLSEPEPVGAAQPTATALAEILSVAGQLTDPRLRVRLVQAHRRLSAERNSGAEAVDARLAPREADVLRLAAVGASNAEIATELELSPQTVKAYLRSAMRRLDVRNRTAAVHVARSSGLL